MSKHTTAVVMTSEQYELLRNVAAARTLRGTTPRMSVSEIVREALDAYAPKLRIEIAGAAR